MLAELGPAGAQEAEYARALLFKNDRGDTVLAAHHALQVAISLSTEK